MEERRGRPKETQPSEQPRKFNRVYEDEDTIETWKYDIKVERQMKKINERNKR